MDNDKAAAIVAAVKSEDLATYRDYVSRLSTLTTAEMRKAGLVAVAVGKTPDDLLKDAAILDQIKALTISEEERKEIRQSVTDSKKTLTEFEVQTQAMLKEREALRVPLYQACELAKGKQGRMWEADKNVKTLKEQAPHLFPDDPDVREYLAMRARKAEVLAQAKDPLKIGNHTITFS